MMTAFALNVLLADPHPWGWWGGGGPGGWFWVFPLAWLAFWAILVGLLVWYLVAGRRRSALDDARRILAERYARGELTAQEYRDRLSQLR